MPLEYFLTTACHGAGEAEGPAIHVGPVMTVLPFFSDAVSIYKMSPGNQIIFQFQIPAAQTGVLIFQNLGQILVCLSGGFSAAAPLLQFQDKGFVNIPGLRYGSLFFLFHIATPSYFLIAVIGIVFLQEKIGKLC